MLDVFAFLYANDLNAHAGLSRGCVAVACGRLPMLLHVAWTSRACHTS